jgi:hypothetical protein
VEMVSAWGWHQQSSYLAAFISKQHMHSFMTMMERACWKAPPPPS